MDDLVNNLADLRSYAAEAGVTVDLAGDRVKVTAPGGETWLRVVRLHRPSSAAVVSAAAADVFLVLSSASPKAVAAAAHTNHTVLPKGGFRVVAPGAVLIREVPAPPVVAEKRVRFTGRTGVVAETLLLGGRRPWSVHEVAKASGVSPALAHRALARLDVEGFLESEGAGPDKNRFLADPAALAELWSQEERPGKPRWRGYLYGAGAEAIVEKLMRACPEGAVGGVFAANQYRPTLTRVPFPVRFWVPEYFPLQQFAGLEEAEEGANLELYGAKGDPWWVHRVAGSISRVSGWRAWTEIAGLTGRSAELADALLTELRGSTPWK